MIRLETLPGLKKDREFERVPHYVRIYEVLYEEIRSGRAMPGDPIPSENAMANHWKVSRGTVRTAIQRLAEDGYLLRGQGKKTVVSDRARYKKDPLNILYDSNIDDAVVPIDNIRIRCGYQLAISLIASALEVPENTLMVSADIGYYSGKEKLAHRFCTISDNLIRCCGVDPDDCSQVREFLTKTIYTIAKREYSTYMITLAEHDPSLKNVDPHVPLMATEGIIYGESGLPLVYYKSHKNALKYRGYVERKAAR